MNDAGTSLGQGLMKSWVGTGEGRARKSVCVGMNVRECPAYRADFLKNLQECLAFEDMNSSDRASEVSFGKSLYWP